MALDCHMEDSFYCPKGGGDECHQITLNCDGPPTTIMCYYKLCLMYMDHGILKTRDTHLEPVLRSSCVLGFSAQMQQRNTIRLYTRSLRGVWWYRVHDLMIVLTWISWAHHRVLVWFVFLKCLVFCIVFYWKLLGFLVVLF